MRAAIFTISAWVMASGLTCAQERLPSEGGYGLLHVHGALTESTCHLAMDSAWQEVNIGTIPSTSLKKTGDQGIPARVEIRLENCLPSPGSTRDAWSGNLLWSPEKPSVTVTFVAPSELGLVKITGAQGIALRITDRYHRGVRLGDRGLALQLEPGDNQLIYYIVPERTASPLVVGSWHALVQFRLNYD